jgi:site-specific DNA-methyltransferase (adenine-specific)
MGRWPANLIHDGSDEVLAEFAKAGNRPAGGAPSRRFAGKTRNTFGAFNGNDCPDGAASSNGSAARFFYCAKASRSERSHNGNVENNHPTVKPLALMQYLIRLVKQPQGTVILDPFGGSGSTAVAAIREGARCVIVEQDAKNCQTIKERCEAEMAVSANSNHRQYRSLFAEPAGTTQ